MDPGWLGLPELRDLASNLVLSRLERGFSQGRLARECGLFQAQVSLFESGRRLPSLDQFIRIARALDVPLQRLLGGADRPGEGLKDIIVELRRLGAVDLWVADAAVPGAARRPEEVIALALSGGSPDPRIIETLPALLSWNAINPAILRAHGIATRTTYRLAWLADVALAIDRQKGFPGGCHRGPLERFLKAVGQPSEAAGWDDLGSPSETKPTSPIWRRWKIACGSTPAEFERRAKGLASAIGDDAITGRPRPIRIITILRTVRAKSSASGPPKRKTARRIAVHHVKKAKDPGRPAGYLRPPRPSTQPPRVTPTVPLKRASQKRASQKTSSTPMPARPPVASTAAGEKEDDGGS